jgi:hypothetical protein
MTQANVLAQIGATSGPTFRNRIINGDMYVAQRATSATLTAGGTIANGYATVDRFYGYCTGANVTMAQVSGTGSNRNLLQFTGAASVTAIGCGQRIESLNSYDLAGSTATLSVFIANSLLTTVTWTAYYANTTNTFGTLASPTRTSIATGTFTVTSTLTQYTAQISIPSAATTGIEIVFTVGAQISGTWQLDRVQLEAGSSATGFEYENYTTLLQKCQRYYSMSAGTRYCTYPAPAATYGFTDIVQFPVLMRVAPSWNTNVSYSYAVSSFSVSGVDAMCANYFIVANTSTNISAYYTWTANAEL